MSRPAVWYQVRAEKDGRVFTFGLSVPPGNLLARTQRVLGPLWQDSLITISAVQPSLLERMASWRTRDP